MSSEALGRSGPWGRMLSSAHMRKCLVVMGLGTEQIVSLLTVTVTSSSHLPACGNASDTDHGTVLSAAASFWKHLYPVLYTGRDADFSGELTEMRTSSPFHKPQVTGWQRGEVTHPQSQLDSDRVRIRTQICRPHHTWLPRGKPGGGWQVRPGRAEDLRRCDRHGLCQV